MRSVLALLILLIIVQHASAQPPKPSEPTVSPKAIGKLVSQLGSKRFRMREKATSQLAKIGRPALPALRAAVSHADAEIRQRARQLVAFIESREPDKQAMRKVLNRILANRKLSEAQCVQAFYLVCFARSPTAEEHRDAKTRISQAKRNAACAHDYFLYHREFQKESGQVCVHIEAIHSQAQSALWQKNLAGALQLLNGPEVLKKLNVAADVITKWKTPLAGKKEVHWLFLVTVNRFPDQREEAVALRHLQATTKRKDQLHELLWVLVNTKEFMNLK